MERERSIDRRILLGKDWGSYLGLLIVYLIDMLDGVMAYDLIFILSFGLAGKNLAKYYFYKETGYLVRGIFLLVLSVFSICIYLKKGLFS